MRPLTYSIITLNRNYSKKCHSKLGNTSLILNDVFTHEMSDYFLNPKVDGAIMDRFIRYYVGRVDPINNPEIVDYYIEKNSKGRFFLRGSSCDELIKEASEIKKWGSKLDFLNVPLSDCTNFNELFSIDITDILPAKIFNFGYRFFQQDMANCHGTTLNLLGFTDNILYGSNASIFSVANSPICRELENNEKTEASDIILFQKRCSTKKCVDDLPMMSSKNYMLSEIYHSGTFLSPRFIYQKRSFFYEDAPVFTNYKYARNTTFQDQSASNGYHKIPKKCQNRKMIKNKKELLTLIESGDECQYFTSTIRCQPIEQFLKSLKENGDYLRSIFLQAREYMKQLGEMYYQDSEMIYSDILSKKRKFISDQLRRLKDSVEDIILELEYDIETTNKNIFTWRILLNMINDGLVGTKPQRRPKTKN